MHNAFRDTPLSTGLRQARRAPGFDDATAAARRFGWVVPTYLAHENGSRGFSFERSETYARAFKAHLGGLLTGEGSPGSAARIPVSGYVGAGAMIDAADETAGPDGIDKVELPPGEYGDFAAFKVRGDSNYPTYRNDEFIFVKREGGPPLEFLNRECVIRTEDGRRMLKQLTLGSKKGHFTLISVNAPPMVDERVSGRRRSCGRGNLERCIAAMLFGVSRRSCRCKMHRSSWRPLPPLPPDRCATTLFPPLPSSSGATTAIELLFAEGPAAFSRRQLIAQIWIIGQRRSEGCFYRALLADLDLYCCCRRRWRRERRQHRRRLWWKAPTIFAMISTTTEGQGGRR